MAAAGPEPLDVPAPRTVHSSARFRAGTMRVLSATPTEVRLGYVFHPHSQPVAFSCTPPNALRITEEPTGLVVEIVGPPPAPAAGL